MSTTQTAYSCTDGECTVTIHAESAEAAARQYVDDGDYEITDHTRWFSIFVRRADDADDDWPEVIKVAANPQEPTCSEGEHRWVQTDLSGIGGGVVVTEACEACGLQATYNGWAHDPVDGEQGLTSVSYNR